jgi:DNA-binding NarL/FixJ family response regulator
MSNPLSRSAQNRAFLLTPRERQVFVLLGQGATNRQIGAALGVSPRTIEKHVEHILGKLGVENRTRAALFVKD